MIEQQDKDFNAIVILFYSMNQQKDLDMATLPVHTDESKNALSDLFLTYLLKA